MLFAGGKPSDGYRGCIEEDDYYFQDREVRENSRTVCWKRTDGLWHSHQAGPEVDES